MMGHLILKYLAVPKAPKVIEGKKHIVCIGDSITYGAGVRGKRQETWEYFLEKMLKEEYQVLNYGISGRTLQKEGDYPYTDEKFYTISKELPADICLIMLGTNDAKPYNFDAGRYEKELDTFICSYDKAKQVILMTPPSVFIDPKIGKVGFDIEMANIDGPIYETVKKTAERKGLKLIDLHEYTCEKEDWFVDGVHPNRMGNYKIAEYIYRTLTNQNED